ncbi:MAG: A/G-specific adenine glycosylase, partial [Lachnospiraceae bacterium]|nr:A/G-specific adenine glycosylase [Candidatus Equihabitans merdae]
ILPWRTTSDAYHIWVSEIMLQQTQIAAVIEYFKRFMTELPTVESLAQCPDDHLLKLWEGLGYYSRVRNMKKAAIFLMENGFSEIPADYDVIRNMPGVGPYTAGAISSMAFDLPHPAVDGNVLRVMSRLTGDDQDVMDPKVRKAREQAIRTFFEENPQVSPGAFNEALMELGETVCIPHGEAKCKTCPLADYCTAFKNDLVDQLPVRIVKTKRRIEKKTIFLLEQDGKILLNKRPGTGLLAGLYEFPNIEGHLDETEVGKYLSDQGLDVINAIPLKKAKHLFSHIEWQMIGYKVAVKQGEKIADAPEGCLWVELSDLKNAYAVPSAFDAYKKYLI